ncbi:UNVERIFIED_CONTAM: hypothetical protein GTU68_012990 [Idotea baltica]|nr:hypothetical protein [Idotea baltica]
MISPEVLILLSSSDLPPQKLEIRIPVLKSTKFSRALILTMLYILHNLGKIHHS